MRDLMTGEVKPDNQVVFYDGFLYIISESSIAINGKRQLNIEELIIQPEYDNPLTLEDIAKKYPKVRKVIYEDFMHGDIYNYMNHKTNNHPEEEAWEKIGETIGYV